MSTAEKPFTFGFVNDEPGPGLELTNTSESALTSIEILTVFLKDESPGAAPSQAHIRFDSIERILPKQKVRISCKTWINGKPARPGQNQLERLQVKPGEPNPYVLDISWRNTEGKARFQRIPIGH